MTTYYDAPEVAEIARKIIDDVDEYSVLVNVEVRYVFRDKAATKGGQTQLGKARKISGLAAMLAGANDHELGFFVVEIAHDQWGYLEPAQRVALVDHELAHFDVGFDDDSGKLTLAIKGHDVEEFYSVVRRRGAWQPSLSHFAQIAGQQTLDLQASGLVSAEGSGHDNATPIEQ